MAINSTAGAASALQTLQTQSQLQLGNLRQNAEQQQASVAALATGTTTSPAEVVRPAATGGRGARVDLSV